MSRPAAAPRSVPRPPSTAPPASLKADRAILAGILAAAALAFLLHLNTLGGAFVYDDVYEIRDNPDIRDLSFVARAFGSEPWQAERGYGFTYRPLSWSAATILWWAGGGSPRLFHLVNLLLHALNTLLLGLLARRLLASMVPPSTALLAPAVVTALLFAVHPVHAEAVAWCSGRSDLMATAFFLLAWLVAERSGKGLGRVWISGGLFLAAIFSKETAAAGLLLFVVSLVVRRWVAGRSLVDAGDARWRSVAAQGLALLIYLAARLAALGQIGRGSVKGASMLNPLEGAGYLTRALTALALVPEHLRLLLWPSRLSIEYSFDQIHLATSALDPRALGALVLVAAAVAAAKLGGAGGRAAASLVLLYAASALPASNLLPLPASIFSERYLYLPSATFAAGAALALAMAAGRSAPLKGAALAILAVVLVASAGRTLERNRDWRDAETLYSSSLASAPRAARLHYNLGIVQRDLDRGGESEVSFRRALEIAPGYADARSEMGVALVRRGEGEEGLAELQLSASQAPADAVIVNNLGAAYLEMGRTAEALPHLRRAVALDPRNLEALGNLGKANLDLGDTTGARVAFESLLREDRVSAAAHIGLGAVSGALGDPRAAAASFRRALDLEPANDDAAFNLAQALLSSGDAGGASAIASGLLSRHPGDRDVTALLERARAQAAGRR